MVMIEAMALGCPVIAFDRGAAPEIVAHRKSGFLVEGVNEMVQCIGRIDELDRVAVRAHVERHFTARAMAEKYARVYKKIIAPLPGKVASVRSSYTEIPVLTPLSLRHVNVDVSPLVSHQPSRVAKKMASARVQEAFDLPTLSLREDERVDHPF